MLTRYDGPIFTNPCEVEVGSPDFGYCPDNYDITDGQIYRVYISPLSRDANGVYSPVATPTDYKNLSTYTGIDYLEGFGTKSVPDEQEQIFPDGMSHIVDRTFSVEFQITDSKIVNLEVIRALQSGAPVALWYHTIGKRSFGSNDGIQVTMKQVGVVHESGQTPLSGKVTFTWKNLFDPEVGETVE